MLLAQATTHIDEATDARSVRLEVLDRTDPENVRLLADEEVLVQEVEVPLGLLLVQLASLLDRHGFHVPAGAGGWKAGVDYFGLFMTAEVARR